MTSRLCSSPPQPLCHPIQTSLSAEPGERERRQRFLECPNRCDEDGNDSRANTQRNSCLQRQELPNNPTTPRNRHSESSAGSKHLPSNIYRALPKPRSPYRDNHSTCWITNPARRKLHSHTCRTPTKPRFAHSYTSDFPMPTSCWLRSNSVGSLCCAWGWYGKRD